jgi:nicotinamide-nucleotide amidase
MTQVNQAVAFLTIGDELLSGEVQDTNLPWAAVRLRRIGAAISELRTVPDDIESIVSAVRELSADSTAVVITGGLGPTLDDVTREAVALAFGLELVRIEEIEEQIRTYFISLGREMPLENLRQAKVPRGARVVPPKGGTAPGFMLDVAGCLVAALPGVPEEMKEMFDSAVIPELESRFAGNPVSITRRINTFGVGESDLAGMLTDLYGLTGVRYGFLASPSGITVKLTVDAARGEAERVLDREQALVEERLGELVFSHGSETMEEVVGSKLRRCAKSLALAESLTAGMACSRMANVPGSSTYLRGGVIAYSEEAKREILGIPADVLRNGTVSREVAEEMARAVRSRFRADIGVSTTGVAGPATGGEEKPAGTVCLGLSTAESEVSWETRLPGDRNMVRSIAANAALNVVRLFLERSLETRSG